jgi:nucleolar protein 12
MQEAAVEAEDDDEELSAVDSDASLEMPSSDEEEEDAEDGLEEAYAAKLVAQRLKAEAEGAKNKKRKAEEELDEDEEDEDNDSDNEGPLDINDLVNESLGGKVLNVEKKSKKEKVVDPKKAEKAKKRAEESPDERDARTIFIGNVPSDCSTSNVSYSRRYQSLH